MLRTQAKKQGGFYVCASCRRQHQQSLAQLRPRSRTPSPSDALSPASRTFSSSALSTSRTKLPSSRRLQSVTAQNSDDDHVHTRTLLSRSNSDRRHYSAWGKFGSNTLPGQSNSTWEAALTNAHAQAQAPGTRNPPPSPPLEGRTTAANVPPATGTSAWRAAKTGGSTPPTKSASPSPCGGSGSSGYGRSSAQPPSSPRPGLGPLHVPRTQHSPSTPAWSRAARQPGSTGLFVPTSRSSQAQTSQATPTSRTSAPGFGPLMGTSKPGPSTTPAFGQQNTPWGSGRSNTLGGASGMVPGKPAFGAAGTIPGMPAFGASATVPGMPAFWSTGTAPGQPAFGASGIPPAQSASGTPAVTSDQTASGLDAMKDFSTRQPDDLSSQQDSAPQRTFFPPPSPTSSDPRRRNTGFGPPQRSSNRLLDNSFSTRPPSREAPKGAEFPQLRRRGSKDELFESMSPFNLPPKGSSPPQDSGTPARRSSQSLPFRLRTDKYDQYPDWGAPKDLGRVAPDPVDPVSSPRSFSGERMRKPPQHQNETNSPSPSIKGYSGRTRNKFTYTEQSAAVSSEEMVAFDEDGQEQPRRDVPPPRSEPRESDRRTRPYDDRRRRHRDPERDDLDGYQEQGQPYGDRRRRNRDTERDDLDGYQEQSQDLDRRGKGSKSKKKAKNQGRGTYNDEGGEDYDYEDAMALRAQRRRYQEAKRATQEESAPKTMLLPEYITVYDLAEALRVKPAQFLQDLEQLGFENTLIDSVMTGETAALVAAEYGFDPKVDTGNDVDLKPRPPPEDVSTLPPRPPVVTIMGHVDHGKTTILDYLRKSSVAAGEHGGITQHIGAFSVKLSTGKPITFLDTPGHAAFLSMRQRGANVTDIVVLVVAVDDSVMPQTIEAIKHAQNAKVPIIVAINKIDVDPNRVDHVQRDLADNGVKVEDMGGDIQAIPISGKTGQGIKDLEEAILTLSEIMDVRAETDGMAEGWVLETSVKQDGKAATILVKRGTLRVGDLIVAGNTYTRIRTMRNEAGADVEEALPSTPVEIYGGWRDPPAAGDMVLQAPDETSAQRAVDYRQEIAERALSAAQKAQQELENREKAEREAVKKAMEEEAGEAEEGSAPAPEPEDTGPKIVNIIVRGDVMGSVEAVCGAIEEIGSNEVRPRILRSAPGQITESDVDLMAVAKGCIVNFNNTIPGFILTKAKLAGVKILDHNIIYEVVDDVKAQLSQQLAPIYSQRVLAEAEVLAVFAINTSKRHFKNIAGVKVRTGAVTRGGLYKVIREGEKIHEGKLEALKQGQKNVTEVRRGTDCGMGFEDYDDFQTGDVIQLFENVEEKRYL